MSIYTCSADKVYDILCAPERPLNEYEIFIGLLRSDSKHVIHIYKDISQCHESKMMRICCAMLVDEYNWPMLASFMRPLSNEEYMCFKSRFPLEEKLLNSLIDN